MNIKTRLKIGILLYLGIFCGALGVSAFNHENIITLIITIILSIIAGILWAITGTEIENILKRLKNK